MIEILKKLGKAEIHLEKNEDEIDEIVAITLTDVSLIEDFAEFYQYNLYKPGKSEIIYVDAMALKVATALVEVGKDENVDFRGAVKINYEVILRQVKDQFKFDLKTLHLDSLEKKGLFVKRQPNDKGQVFLSYDKVEFNNMLRYWQIISEIDKWNQKGFVDLKEQAEKVSEVSGDESHCPSCDGPVSNQQKFCPGCGFKLMAA
ncbi:MAG: zinc ribbon domain-containing protein [Bdellovibrionales bacterium]|nr:zinc ribbon domain-containing protein [Bdellovibrionales bacterium]